MLKAFCDGCEVEMPSKINRAVESFGDHDPLYCDPCRSKIQKLGEWRRKQYAAFEEQVNIETEAKKKEIFKEVHHDKTP